MIELRHVSKSFGDHPVLRGVNLIIHSGETFTIIGGSGTGKSVLFKHIIGLMQPDAGEVLVDGVVITRLREKEMLRAVSQFSMVFQGGALFDSMTVRENIVFGLCGNPTADARPYEGIVQESLSMVGLPDVADLLPAELSGGMKKRVAIARAVARKPRIIMYDEPTTGLDPIMSDVINELIIRVNREHGITSIVITHDMVSAYKISSRIAMLYEGRIIEVGTAEEIRTSTNPIVRQFIEGRSQGPIKIR